MIYPRLAATLLNKASSRLSLSLSLPPSLSLLSFLFCLLELTPAAQPAYHLLPVSSGTGRTCLDDFVTGFKTGDNAQANQTKTLRRMHNSMERLASIGQSASMPDVVNDIFERSDRCNPSPSRPHSSTSPSPPLLPTTKDSLPNLNVECQP